MSVNPIGKIATHYKTAAVIAGALSSLAFPPLYWWYVLLLSLVLVWNVTDRLSLSRQVVAVGYWYGFGLFAAGFYWIGNALLIDVNTFGWLYPVTLLGSGAFFGLFTIIPFWLWKKGVGIWHKVFGFAAAWVIMEFVRSFIFTGFPWNLLGTAWAFHPVFIQTASIWGTYGLSFVMLLWAGALYAYMQNYNNKNAVIFLLIPFLLLVFGSWRFYGYKDYDSEVTVRLVQPSISQKMKWDRLSLEDNFYKYIKMSQAPGLEKVDFVIWGETATPFDLDYEPFYRQKIIKAVPPQGYLITGLVRHDDESNNYQPYNSMYVIDDNGNTAAYYDKHHLVPFGEYVPLRKYLPEWVRPIANVVADFGIGEPYKNISLPTYPSFGSLICYEIIFPDAVVNRDNPPQWLVVLTNDGWYGKSFGPYQHLVAAQMRAVEEGITVVRSANSGISAVINPVGKIKAQIPLYAKQTLDVKLPLTLKMSTVYSKWGGKTVCGLMLLILAFWGVYTMYKKRVTKNS